ncbi:MAG: hypothetical protein BWK74_08105 [Desulfobacteraceae bacterium A6]|nr:MAG: hypothetical protein BWK74_08105 [Desulfobacteraceae bacterium A6]
MKKASIFAIYKLLPELVSGFRFAVSGFFLQPGTMSQIIIFALLVPGQKSKFLKLPAGSSGKASTVGDIICF